MKFDAKNIKKYYLSYIPAQFYKDSIYKLEYQYYVLIENIKVTKPDKMNLFIDTIKNIKNSILF